MTISHGKSIDTFGHFYQRGDDGVLLEISETWRRTGDPECDSALRDVFSRPSATVGKDLLHSLQKHAEDAHGGSAAESFLNNMLQPPPPGLLASDEDIFVAQELFLDDAMQIMQALLHYSLAGGLASSRIVRTLEAVSYLIPHVKKAQGSAPSLSELVSQIPQASIDRTFVRLVETLQFVLDVMGCSTSEMSNQDLRAEKTSNSPLNTVAYLLPGGDGWKSAVRVRLLHGVARWRVLERWQSNDNPVALDSIPISQEELAATLGAFSTIPMWCLRRLHVPPTPRQASAYLALWRHVGFYMGVSPTILLRHFSSTAAADQFVATAANLLFFEDLPPSPSLSISSPSTTPPTAAADSRLHTPRGPTLPILIAISSRPPLNTSLAHNIALTTHLLGAPLAAHLGLPPPRLATRLLMHASLLAQRVPHLFARWYPRAAWRAKRRAVLREGMVCSVRLHLGMRTTVFRPRTMGRHGEELGGGDAGLGGELGPGVTDAESDKLDPARIRALMRMWKEMLKEMVVACAIVFLSGLALLYTTVRFVLDVRWF